MKKIVSIALLIMLIISFYQINSMYALYNTKIENEIEQQIGRFNIKINGSASQEITLTDEYIKDAPVKEGTDKQVIDGKIAPGKRMYFEIILDSSDTDVSIKYQCVVATVVAVNNKNININLQGIEESYVKDSGEVLNTTLEQYSYLKEYEKLHSNKDNVYQCIFPLKLINEGWKKSLKIYFNWINDEEQNENDTQIGTNSNANIEIPVIMTFEQYTGGTNENIS